MTESITFVCIESGTERVNLVNQIGTNEIVTFGWYKIITETTSFGHAFMPLSSLNSIGTKITTQISDFGNTFILDEI